MSSQPTPGPFRRGANPEGVAKHRVRFTLRRRPRRARHLEEQANLRAGIEAPHPYPFEPRF